MAESRRSGKLAVILHADIAGSTVLVQRDEHLAHERIQDTFRRFSETIEKYQGRVRELRGDALLAEFERASDAVSATLAFQAAQADYIETLNDNICPIVRVGIAMGEVIIADNTVTGAGVVLAQRVEQLAEPGGVCITGAIHEALPQRMPFDQDDFGEQQVKGFDEPVRVYAVSLKLGTSIPKPEIPHQAESMAPDLPDKPSIAVLPFTNMSGDPDQEYFSDGITEDIITALSKVSNLLVIARNSTFIYKDKAVDVKQVGRDQGVRYVLEGSVRKAGNRVRITAQLVDATTTGQHLWAERYDRDLEDIFAVQDDITHKIVTALDVHLRDGEQARLWSGGTENLEAWECVRLGMDRLNASRDPEEQLRLGRKAIELDQEYAAAWVLLAWSYIHVSDDTTQPEERERALESVRDCAQRALECDPSCAEAYSALGLYHLSFGEYEAAVQNADKSVELAPNHAFSIAISANILNKCGRPERAIERIRKAMRLSPVYPVWFLHMLGQASRLLGKTDEAINAYRECVSRQPEVIIGHVNLATILGEMNRKEEASALAAEILKIDPDFSSRKYVNGLSYSDLAETARFEQGLRKAGLPE